MLSWYSAQIKAHGLLAATRLFGRVVWVKTSNGLLDKVLPASVKCSCCGWTGHKFRDYLEARFTAKNIECPRCYSHPRHRGLYLWSDRKFKLQGKRGRALVFAPERSLGSLWRSAVNLFVTRVDLESVRGVDVMADLQHLPFAENSIDLIWCHHVLTEVENDRKALDELHRVMRSGSGELVVSVALQPQAVTVEFGKADKNLLNQRRIYGIDFADRLQALGFFVQQHDYGLSADEYKHYGVNPDEAFFVCTKNDS